MEPDMYRGADKSLGRPGKKQARKHVRDARDLRKKIEKRAVIKFLSLQGKAPRDIHAILTETLSCFLPGRAKDLSASLYVAMFRGKKFVNFLFKYVLHRIAWSISIQLDMIR